MNSAALAAYELIALVAIGATLTGLLVGYVWGSRTAKEKEPTSEENIMQLFPTSDPLEWDHLPVQAEQEQAL